MSKPRLADKRKVLEKILELCSEEGKEETWLAELERKLEGEISKVTVSKCLRSLRDDDKLIVHVQQVSSSGTLGLGQKGEIRPIDRKLCEDKVLEWKRPSFLGEVSAGHPATQQGTARQESGTEKADGEWQSAALLIHDLSGMFKDIQVMNFILMCFRDSLRHFNNLIEIWEKRMPPEWKAGIDLQEEERRRLGYTRTPRNETRALTDSILDLIDLIRKAFESTPNGAELLEKSNKEAIRTLNLFVESYSSTWNTLVSFSKKEKEMLSRLDDRLEVGDTSYWLARIEEDAKWQIDLFREWLDKLSLKCDDLSKGIIADRISAKTKVLIEQTNLMVKSLEENGFFPKVLAGSSDA